MRSISWSDALSRYHLLTHWDWSTLKAWNGYAHDRWRLGAVFGTE